MLGESVSVVRASVPGARLCPTIKEAALILGSCPRTINKVASSLGVVRLGLVRDDSVVVGYLVVGRFWLRPVSIPVLEVRGDCRIADVSIDQPE